MTGDEYMTLLMERQAEYMAEHPTVKPWMRPLLEWFIQPGDEQLFTPPPDPEQPKPISKPRVYRSAASLRAERDRLQARADRLATPILPDRAAAGGAGLGPKRTARVHAAEDRKLQQYVALTKRISALDSRIARAEAREVKA